MSEKKPLLHWEVVTEDAGELFKNRDHRVLRAKVPGGWLVSEWLFSMGVKELAIAMKTDPHASGGGLVFVPDPEHRWVAEHPR